jgi:hypothetical protein
MSTSTTMERRKPITWTAEEDAELRRIYSLSSAGLAAAAMKKLAASKAVPSYAIRQRAGRLGISRTLGRHRRWTEAELDNLKAYAGRISVRRIARILARTERSVRHMIETLEMSARARNRGYTRLQLSELMGIDIDCTLKTLIMRHPMKMNEFGNFSEAEVALWLWEHMDEIELRKCDQLWLKRMLKEAA